MKISIVIPIYNEEQLLDTLFSRMKEVCSKITTSFGLVREDIEVIFVNDGSIDKSSDMLINFCQENIGYKLINFARNFGHQFAITAGMREASGDYTVIIDGDLQDPPEFIIELFHKAKEGFDVVYAVREKREGETWFKLLTAKLFYLILQKMVNIKIPLNTGDFRIISRRVLDVLNAMPEQHRFIRGMVSWVGFRQTGITYKRDKRYAGKTKFSISKMIRFAIDGITSFSSLPLKFASYLGVVAAFLGFLYCVYALYIKYFTTNAVQGWSSIIIIVLILGGIQLITLGVIGEYIGRTYDENKCRPLYVVEGIYKKHVK